MEFQDRTEEIQTLCERLVRACGERKLESRRQGMGYVYVSTPGGGMPSEIVRCHPNEDEAGALYWYWSWGVPFCPGGDVDHAAKTIAHVVAPAHA